jgi:hypothetical protein
MASIDMMTDELKGSGRGLIEIISRHLPGEESENHRKLSRGSQYTAKIRTEHLSNQTLELYNCASPLGAGFCDEGTECSGSIRTEKFVIKETVMLRAVTALRAYLQKYFHASDL